jgi:putative FmdB family regulatory protein
VPLYDYDCAACGRRFEVIHGVHADGPTACPVCGGAPVKKALVAPAVHFKGTGWAKKERRAPTKATPGDTASEAATGSGGEAEPAADRATARPMGDTANGSTGEGSASAPTTGRSGSAKSTPSTSSPD